ncbi:MAG: TIGR02679 family protein [Oscillibacter sp.]|nr:TIGR02679 family protein [Oscillibacter sp.]
MREQVQKCAEFFRARPGYHRIMTALLQKYRRSGRPAGNVCLPDASEEELEAARSFFGRSFSPPLRFQTVQFEAELQKGPFRGISLKDVLEAYFGVEIKTKKECRMALESRVSEVIRQAEKDARSEICVQWLQALEEQKSGGYSRLRREVEKAPEDAQRSLHQACRSMDWLVQQPGTLRRLAVLSAEATSDPHALDEGSLAGKLLLHLLAFRSGTDFPKKAEQRDQLYFENGILCDSISSVVTQTGLVLGLETGEHPAYCLLRQRHELCTLSLVNLSVLSSAHSPSGRAYIVENEMVFAQLCDRAEQFHSPLICTSGQPSVAALRLLDLLATSGTELFYSGDFDGKGLTIAAQLCARYPGLLKPWHLEPEDYERCRSDVSLSDVSLSLLQNCAGTPLEETAQIVRQHGLAGYQELLIPQLESDLIEAP